MSQPTVLVTGSAGHLGCALMLSLPSLGYQPFGIDILPSETTTRVGSITDRALIASIFTENPSIKHVIHAATLHKPHVESHSKQDFIDTNISGTLTLLEEASRLGSRIESFVFVSTTSTFGMALSPGKDKPAVWIDESVVPIPKNIYGVTKVAAEDMCHLIHRQTGMPVLVLRTSRFFPEADDDEDRRNALGDENLKVLELCYRRADIADVVSACVCAMKKASELRWGKYIISAPSPFKNDEETLALLNKDAHEVIESSLPGSVATFEKLGWGWLQRMDRVYDSSKAVRELGWEPRHTFERAVEQVSKGEEWRSDLTFKVGKKGYHKVSTGVYTIRE